MSFHKTKRKNNIKSVAAPNPQRFLATTVEAAAVQAALKDSPTLDDAGLVHAEITTNYPGTTEQLSEVYGVEVLRAAFDVSKGYITEYDPPIAVLGVSTIQQAESLAIAIAQWVYDKQGTDDINLLQSQTFVQDTLTPEGYWSLV